MKLSRENLAAAVGRQLQVVDACHYTGQILVAADVAVVALAPDHSYGRLQPVQAAGWKSGIAGEEAQEQAALGLAHVLQHLQSGLSAREMATRLDEQEPPKATRTVPIRCLVKF